MNSTSWTDSLAHIVIGVAIVTAAAVLAVKGIFTGDQAMTIFVGIAVGAGVYGGVQAGKSAAVSASRAALDAGARSGPLVTVLTTGTPSVEVAKDPGTTAA